MIGPSSAGMDILVVLLPALLLYLAPRLLRRLDRGGVGLWVAWGVTMLLYVQLIAWALALPFLFSDSELRNLEESVLLQCAITLMVVLGLYGMIGVVAYWRVWRRRGYFGRVGFLLAQLDGAEPIRSVRSRRPKENGSMDSSS